MVLRHFDPVARVVRDQPVVLRVPKRLLQRDVVVMHSRGEQPFSGKRRDPGLHIGAGDGTDPATPERWQDAVGVKQLIGVERAWLQLGFARCHRRLDNLRNGLRVLH
jgi:hypothetical protein